jgi:phage tail-like protein
MGVTLAQVLATLAADAASATVVSGRYVVIQRDPQPGEDRRPVGTSISFIVVDLDADPLAPTPPSIRFNVLIRGVLAGEFSGVWVPMDPDWTGVGAPVFPALPFAGWEVTLTQAIPPMFGSEEIVPVTVGIFLPFGWGYGPWGHFSWGHGTGGHVGWGHLPWGHHPWGHGLGGATLDIDWQFQCEDLTPPRLLTVVGTGTHTARATFDDAMMTSGAGSVLDPAAWTITRENVDPDVGASLSVVEVTAVPGDPTAFDLTFQWEQTPGCQYRATVAATVEDDAGNPMDPAFREAAWAGWAWARPDGRAFDYWTHMLPLIDREMDATRDLKRFANVIQEVLDLLLWNVDHWTDQFDPDLCSDADIDAMLFDLGNPFVWTTLSLTALQRRKLVRALVPIYRLKGTALGIEGACRLLLGIEVRCVDYTSDTWCLGFDALGMGEIAEVLAGYAEPYNLSAPGWPKHLHVKIDDGAEQDLQAGVSAFAHPAAATAAELEAVLGPQLVGGGILRVAAGSPASIMSGAAPFALAPGLVLRVTVDGVDYEVVLASPDFLIPAAATALEVATLVLQRLPGVMTAVVGDRVVITTRSRGPASALVVGVGTADGPLGLTGASSSGLDGEAISVYSHTAGRDASVEIVGGEIADACEFERERIAGTGACILGPGTSYALYCFDIETTGVLPSEVVALIRKIGEYMKPAHTHLINIRPTPEVTLPDRWVLGFSALGVDTMLGP